MGRVILEIGGPNLRPETAHAGAPLPPLASRSPRAALRLCAPTVMKLAAAKLPCTTEVVDRSSHARVGFADVEKEALAPRVVTLGQVQAAQAAAQGTATAAAEPSPL